MALTYVRTILGDGSPLGERLSPLISYIPHGF